jgi:hypothetical protein
MTCGMDAKWPRSEYVQRFACVKRNEGTEGVSGNVTEESVGLIGTGLIDSEGDFWRRGIVGHWRCSCAISK